MSGCFKLINKIIGIRTLSPANIGSDYDFIVTTSSSKETAKSAEMLNIQPFENESTCMSYEDIMTKDWRKYGTNLW